MQYFYFLNNKDIYGINGRFFGSTLSVCDCIDYFKQIGVPEGTSMDLTFGGFNGCYVYANNTLIKTLPSCGYAPEICIETNLFDWNLYRCICGSYNQQQNVYPSNVAYITSPLIPALAAGQLAGVQYQSQVVPIGHPIYSPNWNTEIFNIIPGDVLSGSSKKVATRTNAHLMTNFQTVHIRIRKFCGINLINNENIYSSWSPVKSVNLDIAALDVNGNFSNYLNCPVYIC